jgi:hypothetical protein
VPAAALSDVAPVASARVPGTHEHDVALSFAGEDREYVEQVANLLKATGVRVFYDKFAGIDMWGENLIDYLQHNYGARARYTVAFVSRHSIKQWPQLERQNAQAKALVEGMTALLPVRLDDADVPGLLSTVSHLDGRRSTPAELVGAICRKVSAPD